MKKVIFILLMIFSLSSCVEFQLPHTKHKKLTKPQKRLARLVKKHPELAEDSTISKVQYNINLKGFKRDSTFTPKGDTIIIRENNSTAKYYYNTVTKEGYLSLEAKDTTLKGEIEAKIPQIQVHNPTWAQEIEGILTSPIFMMVFLILLVLFILNKIFKKFL